MKHQPTEKLFECPNGCKKMYIKMVLLGCKRCIKIVGITPNKEQAEKIAEILSNPAN